ncbi:MAG TPA: cytochrome c [Terriglobia bacterium]|nr:cytochrome c [Terriglobia bacterium]
MYKTLITLSFLSLLALTAAQEAKPTQGPTKPASTPYYAIPTQESRKGNPVAATPESLARGKKQYGYDCAMCHGKDGNGKGDVAADMKLSMHDETNPATLKDRTDGELFYIIKKGKDQMPPEGDRVKDETIWDMVNYVRSLVKNAAAKPADEKAPN